MANTNSAVSDSLFSPVSPKDKGQDGQRHFLKLRVSFEAPRVGVLAVFLLFLMWSYLVKGGHSWSLNSLLSFSDFLTTIPTQTYGPEMSPENYLVSHSSIIPIDSVELNGARVIGGEFDF